MSKLKEKDLKLLVDSFSVDPDGKIEFAKEDEWVGKGWVIMIGSRVKNPVRNEYKQALSEYFPSYEHTSKTFPTKQAAVLAAREAFKKINLPLREPLAKNYYYFSGHNGFSIYRSGKAAWKIEPPVLCHSGEEKYLSKIICEQKLNLISFSTLEEATIALKACIELLDMNKK